MRAALHRLLVVGLSTVITVFFSEKAYWYVQGYAYGELVLYYAFPVYACLWAIDAFRVWHVSGVILVSALYAFLVEGVLTPVLYEAGLFDLAMPAYFVGWHGLLSVVFGWYALRRWLVAGRWRRILAVGLAFGLFWGVWSLTYWLPEMTYADATSGRWSVSAFGLYAFAFTSTLALSHGLLGRGLWPQAFKPSKLEQGLVGIALVGLFGVIVLPGMPAAIVKLGVLLGVIVLGLSLVRPQEAEETIFSALTGSVRLSHVLALYAMPVGATGVYALAVVGGLSEHTIRRWLLEDVPLLQTAVGAGLFLWALGRVVYQRLRST